MTPNKTSQCPCHCPGGNPCILNADVPHTLCICHKAACACHSAARYQPNAVAEPEAKHTQTYRPVLAKAR